MSTYTKCPQEVIDLANKILVSKPRHKGLLDFRVKIDFVFAHAERDEKTGEPIGVALKHHGVRALGIARRLGLKDRAMGRGDCEVCLDADWWDEAPERQREAVLAHELTHFEVKIDKRGVVKDDLNRPKINIRPHDYDHGHFTCIANEYGADSIEVQQTRRMFELDGQYYLPGFTAAKTTEEPPLSGTE